MDQMVKELLDAIFEPLYKDWMSEDDKKDFVKDALMAAGLTEEILKENILIGVDNGYSTSYQAMMAQIYIRGIVMDGNPRIKHFVDHPDIVARYVKYLH